MEDGTIEEVGPRIHGVEEAPAVSDSGARQSSATAEQPPQQQQQQQRTEGSDGSGDEEHNNSNVESSLPQHQMATLDLENSERKAVSNGVNISPKDDDDTHLPENDDSLEDEEAATRSSSSIDKDTQDSSFMSALESLGHPTHETETASGCLAASSDHDESHSFAENNDDAHEGRAATREDGPENLVTIRDGDVATDIDGTGDDTQQQPPEDYDASSKAGALTSEASSSSHPSPRQEDANNSEVHVNDNNESREVTLDVATLDNDANSSSRHRKTPIDPSHAGATVPNNASPGLNASEGGGGVVVAGEGATETVGNVASGKMDEADDGDRKLPGVPVQHRDTGGSGLSTVLEEGETHEQMFDTKNDHMAARNNDDEEGELQKKLPAVGSVSSAEKFRDPDGKVVGRTGTSLFADDSGPRMARSHGSTSSKSRGSDAPGAFFATLLQEKEAILAEQDGVPLPPELAAAGSGLVALAAQISTKVDPPTGDDGDETEVPPTPSLVRRTNLPRSSTPGAYSMEAGGVSRRVSRDSRDISRGESGSSGIRGGTVIVPPPPNAVPGVSGETNVSSLSGASSHAVAGEPQSSAVIEAELVDESARDSQLQHLMQVNQALQRQLEALGAGGSSGAIMAASEVDNAVEADPVPPPPESPDSPDEEADDENEPNYYCSPIWPCWVWMILVVVVVASVVTGSVFAVRNSRDSTNHDVFPSSAPTNVGREPSPAPSVALTFPPVFPSSFPSTSSAPPSAPTSAQPTLSFSPGASPSRPPTLRPSSLSSAGPTYATPEPTFKPSTGPSQAATPTPAVAPTLPSSSGPSAEPTQSATSSPTNNPTDRPTTQPNPSPTIQPTPGPTPRPTSRPSPSPTKNPTRSPTRRPTQRPTPQPTANPTGQPTRRPTPSPTTPPPTEPVAFVTNEELKIAVREYVQNPNLDSDVARKYGWPIGKWQVGNLFDFSGVFEEMRSFNDDISEWDVSRATSMESMFRGCYSFDQPLNDWDVSNVRDMNRMFYFSGFGGDISGWNVGSLENADLMFSLNTRFNQDISGWNVQKLQSASQMFVGALSFRQNLCPWGNRMPRTPDTSAMFQLTGCPDPGNPDFNRIPPNPMCFSCL